MPRRRCKKAGCNFSKSKKALAKGELGGKSGDLSNRILMYPVADRGDENCGGQSLTRIIREHDSRILRE